MPFPVGEAAALSAALLWAGTSLVFAEAGRLSTPFAANTFKTLVAVLLLCPILWIVTGSPIPLDVELRNVVLLSVSGLLGLTFGDSMLFIAFQSLGARRGNLIYGTAPIFGAIGGYFFLKEVLTPWQVVGMVAALGGVGFVASERRAALTMPLRLRITVGPIDDDGTHVSNPFAGRLMLGVVTGLLGGVGQGMGALLAKPALAHVPALEATFIRVAAGSAGLVLLGVIGGRFLGWMRMMGRGRLYLAMILGSILGPVVGIWLQTVALERAHTGIVLTLLSTTPLWLLPIGHWLAHDRPTRREVLGMAVALTGIAVLLLM